MTIRPTVSFRPILAGRERPFWGSPFFREWREILAVRADPMRELRFSGHAGASPWHGVHCSYWVDSACHSTIQWTQDPTGVAIEDVRIDLGRGDIPVPEPLLDGPDVIAHFEQVGCERMPAKSPGKPIERRLVAGQARESEAARLQAAIRAQFPSSGVCGL